MTHEMLTFKFYVTLIDGNWYVRMDLLDSQYEAVGPTDFNLVYIFLDGFRKLYDAVREDA